MELILGHNQFIGISHISEERSRERNQRFSTVENIYRIVEQAADLGFSGMVIESHPRMIEFLEYYKKTRTVDIEFYLQLPYIQGYVAKINEQGFSGLLKDIIKKSSMKDLSTVVLGNILNAAKMDYLAMATSLLRLEASPFLDVKIKALLLHNVLSDLLLSLHLKDSFCSYRQYVEKKLKIKAGIVTLNFHLFKTCLDSWNIPPFLVMTPINPMGFDMNPSQVTVEANLKEYNGKIIAMNVLGGGAFSVQESFNYLQSIGSVTSAVVGASSEEHLKEIIDVAKKYEEQA